MEMVASVLGASGVRQCDPKLQFNARALPLAFRVGTMNAKEMAMVELSELQRQALAIAGESPVPVIDPDTHAAYVLIRREVYERLKDMNYDDSPWTDEEMDLLAAEDANTLGWEGMEAYQDETT
jgi:hypothetical protein